MLSGAKLLTDFSAIALDILSVDPKHHYRGAGRMLVDWGIKKADELDFEVSISKAFAHMDSFPGCHHGLFVDLQYLSCCMSLGSRQY